MMYTTNSLQELIGTISGTVLSELFTTRSGWAIASSKGVCDYVGERPRYDGLERIEP